MITEILSVLYFFLPAYAANMAPVFVKKIQLFDWPLDFENTLRGKRVFGTHKTWRGLIFGVLVAMIVMSLQQFAYYRGFTQFALFPYDNLHVLLGAAMGLGALIGDALESTLKRQMGIRDGGRLIILDQLDFLIGAALVTIPYWIDVWQAVIIAFGIVLVLTMLVQRIGYWLKLKDDPL